MSKENLKTIFYLFFVLSGMTGLIFQVTWFKYLSLFLGNTTYAQTIVLATFLGGLAIGNYIFGKFSDKIKGHLAIYGFIELIIGIYCLLYPQLVNLYENIFYSLVDENLLTTSLFSYLFIKFFIAVLNLLLPTILMGGTLPLLTKFFTEKIENIRKENASLYFLNSFGAVVGIFFAGFVFIKTFGLDVTIVIGGIINIIIGTISIFLNSYSNLVSQSSNQSNIENNENLLTNSETGEAQFSKKLILVLILVAGLSGFASLMYEVLWTRILITIFGSSTYSFSIMLIAFISGITIGSFIVSSNFISKFNRIKLIIFSQLMIAFTILIALMLMPYLPYQFWKIGALFNKNETTFTIFLSLKFFICFMIMFIPTIFMGMTLPLIVEVVAKHLRLVGYSVGTVFSVNTFGNVLGSLMAGLLFIPTIGIKSSFILSASINVVSAVLLIMMIRKEFSWKEYSPIFGFTTIVVFMMIFLPDWDKDLTTSSVFRRLYLDPPRNFSEYKKIFEHREIIYYKDGISGNVSVIQTKDTLNQKILLINGKPDASDIIDLPTQLLLGHIPMLLHDNPQNIFVVGYGSGSTINAILKHNPKQVICSEISKEVVEAAKLFSNINENCFEDPRLKIIVEDGQSILKLTKQKFDVVISEPSNPWIAGVGNLFSKEYFERCKSKLNENGIMCQWFHIYEMDDDVLSLVISTFNSVFPYVQIWGGAHGDLILIGSNKNLEVNFEKVADKINNIDVKNNLAKIGINNIFTFLSTQILSPEGSYTLTNYNIVNSERKPILEFLAPLAFYKGTTSLIVYQNDEKFDTLNNDLLIKSYSKSNQIENVNIINAIEYHHNRSMNFRFAFGLSNYLLQKEPNSTKVAEIKYQLEEKLNILKVNIKNLFEDYSKNEHSGKLANLYANQILNERINSNVFLNINNIDDIERIFLRYHRSDELSDVKFYSTLASAFLKNSNPVKALEYCLKVEEILSKNPDIPEKIDLTEYYYTFATSALYLTRYDKLVENFIQLINYNQNYPPKKLLSKRLEWRVKEDRRQDNAN